VISVWSYSKAVAAIEQFGLVEKNMRLACYWLSLWEGDAPPTRESFDPRKVVELLPGIGLVDMHEDKGPICRLSGTAIDRALGRPVTGTNLLDFLPEKDRGTRLTRLNAILDGGISVSRTAFSTRHGTSNFVETLQLPLYGRCETGTRQYLAHANWRPNMGFAKDAAPGLKLGLPETFELVSFT
jgi:hypothetical protein